MSIFTNLFKFAAGIAIGIFAYAIAKEADFKPAYRTYSYPQLGQNVKVAVTNDEDPIVGSKGIR